MAIQAKATKGGITINATYILVINIKMDKYLRPTIGEDGLFAGNVVDVKYAARAELYATREERDNLFGSTPFNTYFEFPHVEGGDLVQEAYEYIKTNGIQGWTLEDMVDA